MCLVSSGASDEVVRHSSQGAGRFTAQMMVDTKASGPDTEELRREFEAAGVLSRHSHCQTASLPGSPTTPAPTPVALLSLRRVSESGVAACSDAAVGGAAGARIEPPASLELASTRYPSTQSQQPTLSAYSGSAVVVHVRNPTSARAPVVVPAAVPAVRSRVLYAHRYGDTYARAVCTRDRRPCAWRRFCSWPWC